MGLRSRVKSKLRSVIRKVIDQYVAKDIPEPMPPPPQKTEVSPQADKPVEHNIPQKEADTASQTITPQENLPQQDLSEDKAAESKDDVLQADSTQLVEKQSEDTEAVADPKNITEDTEAVAANDSLLPEEKILEEAEITSAVAEDSIVQDSAADESGEQADSSSSQEPSKASEQPNQASSEQEGTSVQLKEHTVEATLESSTVTEAVSESKPKESSEDKAKKFRLKVKKSFLLKIKEAGGQLSLHDLHEHSEQRFFIAHQIFSELMEELVDEDLVEYSYNEGLVYMGPKSAEFLG